ncbi:LOW QUALITY PROTEIN: protein shisa-5-like [Sparus aurata]|uniref:LOW QUALITY PROTEIN: protein shisa-5-like n=1 Tax=Sparus aurata TaxID=8175 RepID=UPI0011C0FC27|nr:LOW QUALITY PROTEIN: protein shisa-5-like [Sparus aurata]
MTEGWAGLRLSEATVFLDDLRSSRSADCSSAPTVRTESRVLPESGNLSGAMASGLCSVVVLALCVTLAQYVSAGSKDCESYTDIHNTYHESRTCRIGFCCGSCNNRYCCQDSFWRFTEEEQENCMDWGRYHYSPVPMVLGIVGLVASVLIVVCCCVCPCCCLYKMCRKPRPVIATTTHTTVVTTAPQQYPRQQTATPAQPQSYQGAQYAPYQPVPVQPGYGAHPPPQGYGAHPPPQGYGPHPPPQGYGAQPMPTSPYHGQPLTAGPPPTYQEATGPGYPPNPMPYSQAAFAPGQQAYPLQPPVHPQPGATAPHVDYLAQPAYNPDFVAPPPKTG